MRLVSIIIPVRAINSFIRESVANINRLNYNNYEILVFPDEACGEALQNSRIIASGPVGPAEKRDMALEYAAGEILAFIDDDAYPDPDWLKNAVAALEPEDVGAVGGPAVTAPEDNVLCRAGGKVYESFLCSGKYTYRYIPGETHDDDDIPSVNLIVKKEIFKAVGGYDSTFYPGEDTKLCLDITHKLGKRLVYKPDVLVYHHRRPLFRAHLKQVTNYAKHRGYFVKALPATSLRLPYFIPTLFSLGVIIGIPLSLAVPIFWWPYGGILLIYFILAAWSLRKCENLLVFSLAILGIFATHIGYGVSFVRGLLSRELIR